MVPYFIIIYGFFMFFAPEKCIKKECRDDPKKVARAKKGGLIIGVYGLAFLVLLYVLDMPI